jgi:hypothetical protein
MIVPASACGLGLLAFAGPVFNSVRHIMRQRRCDGGVVVKKVLAPKPWVKKVFARSLN